MKLTLHCFKSNIPREKVCQPGVEYEVFDIEVGPDQAFSFFDRLIFPRDSFYLEASMDYLVDFWKHEKSIWVEVTGSEFWATSEVSLDEAKAIIDSLDRGERFGNLIPTTMREWDAYTPASEK